MCYLLEKSTDMQTQRETYSGQKKRNLFKLMIFCTPDGRIVGAYGPFKATMNDAKILELLLKHDRELRDFLFSATIILDRGFRDCVRTLQQKYQLTVHLPACELIFNN